jgi:hypothetical protein
VGNANMRIEHAKKCDYDNDYDNETKKGGKGRSRSAYKDRKKDRHPTNFSPARKLPMDREHGFLEIEI